MSKYLYNGVELPALPEWDKTVYPYAFIYIVTLDGTTGVYTLVVSSSSVMGYDENGIICPAATVGQRYTVSEDSWAAAADSDDFYIKRDNLIYTVWANFDVLNSDGSVYVAASEPVPLMEKFPIREWIGWLIAGLCSRPLPMGARAPVAYLYNGVRLPPLPEWDKETYPYQALQAGYFMYCMQYKGESMPGIVDLHPTNCGKFVRYYYSQNSGWIPAGSGTDNGNGTAVVPLEDFLWANYDIFDPVGNLYLAASDPIPVYE